MEQRKRVAPLDEQFTRNYRLGGFNSPAELGFRLGNLQGLNLLLLCAYAVGNHNDFVKEPVFLVLDHPPVVGKGTNTQPLILASTTLKEHVAVWTDQRY